MIIILRDYIYFVLTVKGNAMLLLTVPNGSPVDIRAEPKSSTELMVTWEPPLRESWNGNLLGYHIGYQELSSDDTNNIAQTYIFKTVEVRPHYGGEATLQGLSKFTTYSIIVQVKGIHIFHTILNDYISYIIS